MCPLHSFVLLIQFISLHVILNCKYMQTTAHNHDTLVPEKFSTPPYVLKTIYADVRCYITAAIKTSKPEYLHFLMNIKH